MSTVEIRLVTETTDTFAGIKVPDIISMGIRDLTWSQYSHVEFVLDADWNSPALLRLAAIYHNRNGLELTIGARHSDGVQIRPSDYEKYPLDDRFLVETTPERKAKIINFVLAQVGKPYDTSAILGILAHRDWRNPDSWFCSELVEAGFEAGDEPLLYVPSHINRITPRDTSLSIKLVPKVKA